MMKQLNTCQSEDEGMKWKGIYSLFSLEIESSIPTHNSTQRFNTTTMHFTATSIAGFLLALRPVAADFSVFTIQDNPATDADVQTNGFKFFNNPPDCDDINNSVPWINGWNDASDGGAACDGCDGGKNVLDWDVTRFEINDNTNDYFAGPHDNMHMSMSSGQTNRQLQADNFKQRYIKMRPVVGMAYTTTI